MFYVESDNGSHRIVRDQFLHAEEDHSDSFRPTTVDGVPVLVRTNDEITTDEMWEDDRVIWEDAKMPRLPFLEVSFVWEIVQGR